MKAARVSRGVYRCNKCNYEGKRKEFHMDHVEPIVPIEGFSNGMKWDWNEYLSRMYCEPEGYQILCTSCHKDKTKKENELRRKLKKTKNNN